MTCAELLRAEPHRLALLEAWLGWRGNDSVPIISAVKAEDLGTAIGYVSVLEMPSPDTATFRLVGEWYDKVAGWKLLGENFINMVAEAHRPVRSERLWNMVSTPCGMLSKANAVRPSGGEIAIQSLSLPVRPASQQEPMRLYTAVDVVLASSMAGFDSIEESSAHFGIEYVDIGFGVP